MEVNSWQLYSHRLFVERFQKLVQDVKILADKDPEAYQTPPKSKLLAIILKLVLEVIPSDPNSPEFRQGGTLGQHNKHWFRAKFNQRYRLFFRFSTKHQAIVYVWLNDAKTLRKAGSKTDPYYVFAGMLEQGEPPQDFDTLLESSTQFDGSHRLNHLS